MCYVQATTFKSHLKSKSEGAQASGTGLNGLQPKERSPAKSQLDKLYPYI